MKAIGGQPQLTSNAAMAELSRCKMKWKKTVGGGPVEDWRVVTELNKNGVAGFS